jgi:purine-binding chemotaxis protein CheW
MPLSRPEARRAAALLEARTRQLARRSTALPVATRPVLVCAVGQEFYGIALPEVARVLPFTPCARVPGTPQAMLGLVGRAGQLFSALDLGTALGLRQAGAGPASDGIRDGHLLLLRRVQRRFALRVDRVLGLAQVTPLEAPDPGGAITGHAPIPPGLAPSGPQRLMALIELDRLLQSFLAPSEPSGA